ncbi:hypothetical protein HDU97_007846 [Phlyctochytrium planicorne]|nr:hypothetical protein HDU97_007846 [Phlyctochytrium planicorne]
MSEKVIVIAGFGVSISKAVAEKASSAKLSQLTYRTLRPSKPPSIKSGTPLAPLPILWNQYGPFSGILDANVDDLILNFNLSNTSLLVAVKTTFEDLKANKGAVLNTGGGSALENDDAVKKIVKFNAASAVIAKAAACKTVHLINETLKEFGVYVGELTVLVEVKGTPFDVDGKATLTAEDCAEAFFKLEKERDRVF